ncbi:DUF4129 domain-containing protein [Catellatospora chokoriensis]|uniref:Protein-glutamine gamma-glutamyltransferase-like C-terminal domain-containing protein n=1 Tax=Catellatospora chokoriensis TaxID=310353 RepID=A0A8J3K3U4_9ACTN|nr:DUF4129 domain-containing protein [Catellatospora chokoriensis]GIF92611.1 hypothetical protein Cch02nite_60550 [Catellatospora chokoriensis]
MRWWNETVAVFDDVIPFGLAAFLLLLLAAIAGVLWYTFPAWLPTRWRVRRTRSAGEPARDVEPADDRPAADEDDPAAEELPALAPEVYLSQADRYAAEGRWAEAVRERLRAMVRELVDRGVVEHVPGWTVTELARAAGGARPELGPAVQGATGIFSGIWYAQRPATAGDDEQMRGHLATVHELVRGGR